MNMGDDRGGSDAPDGRKRGGCLSAFLIVGLVLFAIGTIYLVIISIFGASELQQAFPSISREYWLWGAVLGMANFIAFLGIWWWRKWGVYAFIAISLIGFIVDLTGTLGGGVINLVRGLVLVSLLLILVRGKWSMME
jgi:hypothetical protein